MSFAGLSAIGPGMQQGQMNLASLQQKAQQIQQMQMQIDASKRELQAQASLFQGLPGAAQPPGNATPGGMPGGSPPPQMGQQGPQPMPPGQPSMPAQDTPFQKFGPGGQGGPPQPPMAPQGAPQGGPGMGGQQQPGGMPGAGGQDLSPQAQMQLLTQIAQSIKQRSPGIDPLTLFEAVKQQIGLMGALSNTQKQQLVFAADQIKAQVQTRGQDVRAETQERGQDIGAQNTDKRVGAQERGQDLNLQGKREQIAGMIQANNARIQDADNRLNQTQAAINARQDKSLQGRAANKAQTERLKMLRDKVAQAKQKQAEANASMDPDKISIAQQAVDAALAQVTDFQGKVVRGTPAPAGGDGGGGQAKYTVGQIIDQGGKKYRVTGGDLSNDPDVELVQ